MAKLSKKKPFYDWKSWSSEKLAKVFTTGFIILGVTLYSAAALVNCQSSAIVDFVKSVATNFIEAAITFWVLNQLLEKRRSEEQEDKHNEQVRKELITDLGSNDNQVSLNALNQLRDKGWLQDGSLRKAILISADMSNANLFGADLQGADLRGAKLHSAILRKVKLQGVNLKRAELYNAIIEDVEMDSNTILPDGKKYDGNIDMMKYTRETLDKTT